MKAVILAGGQGSRLRPLTENIPKPMVSVLGRPIMEHIVRHLQSNGVDDIVATLHYKPRPIRDHFGDGSEFGVNMHYTLEKQPLGTAGSVKLSEAMLDETFLVIGGDALVDFDFRAFLDFHREKNARVSLCLMRVPDPGEFGVVITDAEGRVQRFLEKPGPSEVFSDTVNTGIYLIEPEVLSEIPIEGAFDFAGDLFPKLMEQDTSIYGYVAEGYWGDIGSIAQLRQSNWDMLDGKVNLPVSGNRIQDGVWIGENTEIAPDAVINGPCWLGDGVLVRSGARIGPYAMLGDGVEIDRNATISRSVVMRNSFVGELADLRNCIVASRDIIEAECEIGAEAVIGSECRLGPRVVVNSGVLIWPNKEIDSGSVISENLVWESVSRPTIFGSRGVSGLANLHVTPEFAAMIGKAFGATLKRGQRVAVSRDSHPFSRLIKRALVSGLLAVGIHVDDLEETTAPITRFVAGYGHDCSGSVHIRVSELHSEVATIELFNAGGLPLTRPARRKVEAAFHRADFPKVSMHHVGELRYPGRVTERYIDHIVEYLDLAAISHHFKQLIYFTSDESTERVMNEILKKQDVSHMRISTRWQGEESIRQIADIARLNNAIGMVLLPGSERLLLVDEDGETIAADRTKDLVTAAFIRSALPDEPVFLSANAPAYLLDDAKQQHRKVETLRVEPAAMLEQATKLAGETDRWLEFRHPYLGFDAMVAGLYLLSHLGREGISLRDFDRKLPISHRRQMSFACPWDAMGRVMRSLAMLKEADTDASPEGLRLQHENGSILVLPSADHPELLVTVETSESKAVTELVEFASRTLQRIIG